MNKSKKNITLILSILILICTIVPIYAASYYPYNRPNNLGDKIEGNGVTNGIYYLKVIVKNSFINENIFTGMNNRYIYIADRLIWFDRFNQQNSDYISRVVYFGSGNNNYSISEGSFYFVIAIGDSNNNYTFELIDNENITTELYTFSDFDYQHYYDLGYVNGYANGYNEGYIAGIPAGAGILEDLNFVENIEMLIGKFTGDDYAQYITPIAIVLAILLVYFIFIRFLLSLIKAKGVIKVCDIVTLVACISILVVMYLPMIDFTITQHQLVEQVYSVAADVTP